MDKDKKQLSNFQKLVIYFIMYSFIGWVCEEIFCIAYTHQFTFFLQALFANRWWDYTGEFLNLNGRITLSFSLVWGIGALIFIDLIHPFITKIVSKILAELPVKIQKITANTLIVLVAIDTIASSIVYLNIL